VCAEAELEAAGACGAQRQYLYFCTAQRQHLYFCASKASKLGTGDEAVIFNRVLDRAEAVAHGIFDLVDCVLIRAFD
jgi:hypothetical protein